MKTKFINCSEEAKETKKETVFTHYLSIINGWEKTIDTPSMYKEVKYMGKCESDGDYFVAYTFCGLISTFKGIKGDEFN